MRKYLICAYALALCFALCGCQNKEKNGVYVGVNEGKLNFDLQLDQKKANHPEMKDYEITDEMAIEIGNAAIKAKYGEETLRNTHYSLSYLEDQGIYWFARWSSDPILGGDYEVAINKKNGAIELIWMGE